MSKEIDYISFTGQQYVFSGVTVNGNSTIEITCAYTGTGSDTGAIFGSRTTESGTDSTSFTMFVVNGAIRIDHFGTSKTLDKNKYNPKGKHTYKITPDTVYCDGTKIYTHTVSSNSAPNKLHIGAVCTNGTISELSNVNIYSFKFYDGSNLILNLIPYKDNNKKYCFKDLVNNKLYYSGAPEELKGFDSNNIKTGDILNFDYTGAVQSITLPKGTYKLECWGAQGGNRSQDSASATVTGSGLGGYSIGTLTLTQSTTCYIYVGGQGGMSSSTGNVKVEGGFNGGGFASHESTGEPGNGGGGATDVRISQDSLYARVIVAGGGGGSGEDNETGGYGGGETGGAGSRNTSLTQASQTSGGTNSFGFGLGGNTYNGGAGGGGWYGGASRYSVSSYSTGSDSEGGGGGSGYVYTSSTAKNYPSGCLLNSSYYLSDAKTIAGNTSFTSPTGSSETGHSGNGYCRITVIECKSAALYAKVNNSLKKATSICFKMNNKIYGIGIDNSSSTNMNFSYTGSVQTVTLDPGKYILECWGAQGGYRSSSSYGGAGGYSIGTLSLSSKTTLYIYVGGSGNSVTSANSSGYYPGGFNGGGYRNTYKGGGGATDIRIGTDSLYSRVIVAGGGGSDGSSSQSGGYAGGTSGARGSFGCGSYGYGGNQTATYSSLNAIASQGTNNNSSDCAAGFGFGGFGCYSSSGYGGAGGGGWYGGQGTYPDGSGDDDGGGGGGSGYVYTSSTASNYPSGCLLNSTHYLTNAQTIAGNQSFTSPTGSKETGHTGNGFCRITNLNPKQYGMFIKHNGVWTHINL
uniref:receptor protein-tyrosine kinase n=1 Tax=virus sp. ctX0L1 TaxID=2827992 RepID=A0A8S5SE10_9VIRU|nr:MAG TPA: Glycine rich protein [virus sp. ctX0L1]